MAWLVPKHIPLPGDFVGFSPECSSHLQPGFERYTRHLPHWRLPGASYLCTFRLRDSLPADVVLRMQAESEAWRQHLTTIGESDQQLSAAESQALEAFHQSQTRRLDLLLDEGLGECLLRHPENRASLAQAFHHGDGQRVDMLAYAIMPNHAHVLCRPLPGHTLESLTASWKRRSSQQIHQALGRRGPLWQDETWDRIIRDPEHYATAVRYIAKNPWPPILTPPPPPSGSILPSSRLGRFGAKLTATTSTPTPNFPTLPRSRRHSKLPPHPRSLGSPATTATSWHPSHHPHQRTPRPLHAPEPDVLF